MTDAMLTPDGQPGMLAAEVDVQQWVLQDGSIAIFTNAVDGSGAPLGFLEGLGLFAFGHDTFVRSIMDPPPEDE